MPFQKGEGGRPPGAKNKKTLQMEERRAIFEQEMSEMFLEKIRQARPEYLLDQFIGKAPEKIEHSGEIKNGVSIPAEALAIIEEDLKAKKMHDEPE